MDIEYYKQIYSALEYNLLDPYLMNKHRSYMATAAVDDTIVGVEVSFNAQEKQMEINRLGRLIKRIKVECFRLTFLQEKKEVMIKDLVDVLDNDALMEVRKAMDARMGENAEMIIRWLEMEIKKLEEEKQEEKDRRQKDDKMQNLIAEVEKLKEIIEKEEFRKQVDYVGFGRRGYSLKVKCFGCKKFGHKIAQCDDFRSKRIKEQTYWQDTKQKKRRVMVSYANIEELKARYSILSADNDKEIKFCSIAKCKIETEEGKMVIQKGANLPQALEGKAQKHLERLMQKGIIRESSSNWRNPIRFLEKANGDIRLVVNLMKLNDLVVKDNYSISNMKTIIQKAYGSSWFTVVDLKEAFYSIEMEERDKHKTAFEFKGNVYEWNSMVMGYKNSPMILQRVMDIILKDYLNDGVQVYLDDIIIHAKTREKHDELVDKVLKKLYENNLRLNLEKIQYAKNEVEVLGVKINGDDIIPLEEHKDKIIKFGVPSKIKDVRKFLGSVNWLRAYIKNIAEKTYFLTSSLKVKDERHWQWTKNMQTEFESIKNEIKEIERLQIVDYDKMFVLRTDASNVGIGAVLMQQNKDGELKVVEYASKKLTPSEMQYGITEKEMLGVFWGVKKFDYELRGRKFTIETDHKALERIREKPNFDNVKVNRMVEHLMEYDFDIKYIKGEIMGKADELSREECVKRNKIEERTTKMINTKYQKHVKIVDGIKYWQFNDDKCVKLPEVEERKDICVREHEKLQHRGAECVYYSLKQRMYWPGIKATIEKVVKQCAVCQENNRKKRNAPVYVESSKPFEKVAIDIMHLSDENKYLLVGIDYFTRFVATRLIDRKDMHSVTKAMSAWFSEGHIPETLISDNGKEFVNSEMENMCKKYGIEHVKVGVESHRSNERVERIIGTLREYYIKNKEEKLEIKIKEITKAYNNTYHSTIGCTPKEALSNHTDIRLIEKNQVNRKTEKKKKCRKTEKKEKCSKIKDVAVVNIGDKVRVSQHENINKYMKGRFLRTGLVMHKYDSGTCLVKMDDTGKITKKREHDVKIMV